MDKKGIPDLRSKTDSIKRYLLIGGIGGSVLLLLLLMCFGGYIILQYRHVYKRDHAAMTSDYSQQLARDIGSMEAYIKNLYGNNVHYQMLKRSQITESQWMLAVYYLNNNFSTKADNLDYFGGVFYYDQDWDSLYSEFSGYPYAGDSYRLNQTIKKEVRAHTDEKMPFASIMTYEGETYLLYMLGDRGKFLGYTVNLSRYFVLRENMQLIISDAQGIILANLGDRLLDEASVAERLEGDTDKSGLKYMISRDAVEGQNLQLMLIHKDEKLAFWNQPEFWLLFILIPLAAFAVLWNVYRFVKKIIYQPIDHFVHRLTEMKRGETPENSGEAKEKNQLEEIQLINDKLDELIAEMGQLEQEKYKKEKEANAALLQYYQLQVRPHFFLNCLNIIASLLNENDVDMVKTMIFAVSRHFRYVFQDSDSLVTLADEIEEVKAYCNIYIIKNAMPILLQISLEEETKSCRIPILCVQTFVENSVKYAVNKGRVLSISITADRIEDDGECYTRIHISDNGEGYRPERLEQLNRPVTEFQYHSMQVGVDNIKYRVYLLYGEKAKIYFYNSPTGGAVTEILLPQRDKFESSFQTAY